MNTSQPPAEGSEGWRATSRAACLLTLALLPFSLARLALFLAYREDFAALSPGSLASSFLVGLRFDLAGLLPFLLGPLALLCLPPIAERAARRARFGWLGFVLLVPLTLLLVADHLYYAEVHRHVGRELVLIAHDPGYVGVMLLEHLGWVIAGGAFLVVLAFAWRWLLSRPHRNTKKPYLVFALTLVLGGLGIRGSLSRKPLNPIDAYRSGGFARGNLCLNGVYTGLRSSLKSRRPPHNALTRRQALEVLGLSPDARFPVEHAPAPRLASLPDRPNVVLLLLESWDARYMGAYGAAESLTPHFDRWARTSLLFERVYATTQRTIGGVQATLTGIPSVPGVPELGHGLEHTGMTRIANVARARGYRTFFLQAPRRRSYYLDSVALSLGFQAAYGKEDYPLANEGRPFAKWGWDEDALAHALRLIDQGDGPFFVVLLTGTTHSPYVRPGPAFELDPHETHGLNGYRNTLRYADSAVHAFLQAAQQRPWAGNTAWIACADHVFRSAGEDPRDNFRIPLLIDAPGLAPGRRAEVRSQLDVFATLVELLGAEEAVSSLGPSLLRTEETIALTKQGSVMGAFAADGYVLHSIEARVGASELNESRRETLEKHLLATQRTTLDLVSTNRWGRDRR